MKSIKKWYPLVTILAIDVAFAISNILIKKIIGEEMNHLVFITYRQLVSTLFLAPIAYIFERNTRPELTSTIIIYLFFSAIVGSSLAQYFFLLGIEYTSATFSCAFLNMVPVITFLMALPFGMETVNLKNNNGRAKLIGAMVCLGGALLLIFYKGIPLTNNFPKEGLSHNIISTADDHQKQQGIIMSIMMRLMSSSSSSSSSEPKAMRWTVGSLALFGGTVLLSSWFILQPSIGKRYPCQYSSAAIMTFFSSIQSFILCFFLYNHDFSIWILKSKHEILTIMYTGMIGSGICYVGMSWCVKKEGPVFTASFSPLVQIIAAFYEVPFLHEHLFLGSVIGSVVVIMGLYILLWGKKKERQDLEANNNVIKEENEEKKQAQLEFQVNQVTHDTITDR